MIVLLMPPGDPEKGIVRFSVHGMNVIYGLFVESVVKEVLLIVVEPIFHVFTASAFCNLAVSVYVGFTIPTPVT